MVAERGSAALTGFDTQRIPRATKTAWTALAFLAPYICCAVATVAFAAATNGLPLALGVSGKSQRDLGSALVAEPICRFVEEAEGGNGRKRPWQIVSLGMRWDDVGESPELARAGDALSTLMIEREVARLAKARL